MSEPPKTSDKLQALIKQITYKNYAKGDPERALLELMDEVESKVHHFRKECWNITIELLADHLGLMTNPWKYSLHNIKWAEPISKPSYPGFKELKEHIPTDLIDAYIVAAKAKPWDYLGEVFIKEELAGRNNRLGQMLTPKQIVDFMLKCVGILEDRIRPDPHTWDWLTAESWNYELKLLELSRELRIEHQRQMRIFDIEPVWEKYRPQTLLDS